MAIKKGREKNKELLMLYKCDIPEIAFSERI